MDEDVKKYHFAREYRQSMAFDEKERIRAIRENIPEKFQELRNKLEKSSPEEALSEEAKMGKETIQICIARYGEDLGRLVYENDKRIEDIYRVLNKVIKALPTSNKSIEER